MWFRLLVGWTVAVALLPAQPLPTGVIKLAAIRRHMDEALKQSRGMLCLQTIERSQWDRRGKLKQSDRLQAEVALIGSRELFAWPGDEAFSRETPADMAGGGLGSSGELISHLSSVFRAPGAAIQPLEPNAAAGPPPPARRLGYSYRIPIFGSAYTIAGLTGKAVVASAGRFWVDEASLDVVRLETRAEDVPIQTGMREVTTVTDYARVSLEAGRSSRLAPQRAVLTTIDLNGATNRNHIEFSHCREFGASSAISFDEKQPAPAASAPIAVPASVKTRLPARLTIRTRIEWPEDRAPLAGAYAGLAIAATLIDPIRHKGKELAPAGASVSGRLRWLERRKEEWMVGVELLSIRSGDTEIRFLASLSGVHDPDAESGVRLPVPRKRERVELPSQVFGTLAMLTGYTEEESVNLLRLPGVGLFTLPPTATSMPLRLELTWVTEQ